MVVDKNESKAKLYLFALAFGLIVACVCYHTLTELHSRRESRLELENSLSSSYEDYASVLLHFDLISEYIYEDMFQIEGLSDVVALLATTDDSRVATIERERLRLMVQPVYERAKRVNVKQLHFHSLDTQSLLRMHRSEMFGDSLAGVQGSVELANSKQEKISAFEKGRIFNGYRCVYPIYHEEKHVGAVEISFGSGVILDHLFKTRPNRKIAFIQPREVVEENVFAEERDKYVASVFAEAFLEEQSDYATSFFSRYSEKWGHPSAKSALQRAFARVSEDPEMSEVVAFDFKGMEHILSYFPIYGVEGALVAGVVAVEPSEVLDTIEADRVATHLIGLGIGLLMVLVGQFSRRHLEKKEAENLELSERLRLLADQVPGILYQYQFCPKTGKYSYPYVSEGIRETLDLTPEDVMNDASLVHARVHPDDQAAVEASALESGKTLDRWHKEMRLCFPDGRLEWVEGFSTPQQLSDGKILWHGYLTKVTGRKEREKELSDARERAEASEKAMARFLATMSHEIRTPMSSIIGLSDLLESTNLTDEQSKFVKNIIDSGNTLISLVSDILDFSKIEAESLILFENQFELKDLVRKVRGIGESLGRARSIEFVTSIGPDLPQHCFGDEARLSQVLLNLVSNAIKFSSDKSRVEFHVNFSGDGEGRALVKFEVVDHGIGISHEDQEKIFDPYLQSENSLEKRFKGVGLGLAISSRLSRLMNGKLSCESTVGIGSRFTFEVPLRLVEADASKADPNESDAKKEDPKEMISRADLNVLVVDDNPSNLHVAVMMLEKMGLKPACAENGQEAVSACLSDNYDLVIMDLEMPVMDGISAANTIQSQLPPTGRPRIVALTANATKVQKDVCFEVGMDDFMTKPIKMERLKEVVVTSARSKSREVLN